MQTPRVFNSVVAAMVVSAVARMSAKTGAALFLLAVILVASGAVVVEAAEFHVSPDGNPWAYGTAEEPWDLETALLGEDVGPGDTIWLLGGTYEGSFTSHLAGTEENPITVRAFPGEWPRIDGVGSDQATFSLYGSWTVYQGFEVTNSEFSRWGHRSQGFYVLGENLTLANLVIHDLGNNGFWCPAVNLMVYGCLIYNNGYDDPSRGHGHGFYAQNTGDGTKSFIDNVIFGGYAWGIHIYAEGGALEGFDIIGNTWFNAGANSTISGYKDNCLIGGHKPTSRIRLQENNGWARTPTAVSVRLGWEAANGDVTLTNNYLVGALNFYRPWSSITMTGNTVFGYLEGVNRNLYPNNDFLVKRPKETRVAFRPNQFEPGRALITIYNWDEVATVQIDPSGVLAVGDLYEVRDVENYFGGAVVGGAYTGQPIRIPMDLYATSQVVGSPATAAEHTPREFGVYMLFNLSLPGPQVDDSDSVFKRSAEGRVGSS